jgi:hypothetical protein
MMRDAYAQIRVQSFPLTPDEKRWLKRRMQGHDHEHNVVPWTRDDVEAFLRDRNQRMTRTLLKQYAWAAFYGADAVKLTEALTANGLSAEQLLKDFELRFPAIVAMADQLRATGKDTGHGTT